MSSLQIANLAIWNYCNTCIVTLSLNLCSPRDIIAKNREETHMPKRKAIINTRECVACGCCIKVCPRSAISIPLGIYAKINNELCIGCGKCAKECPASIIKLEVTES